MKLKNHKKVTLFGKHFSISKILFICIAVFCSTPFVSSPVALAIGIIVAQIMDNPFSDISYKAIKWLLKIAVVGLGFGMSAHSAFEAGKSGFLFTMTSIGLTLTLGMFLGKLLGIDKKITQLISSGTAICGGSAIAAISPIIKADSKQISVSIGIVFLLNSIALFVFPTIGHLFDLTQNQFGIWSAIAIHDTSSVVGVADVYGSKSLEIATTVKLARALWILPVSLIFAIVFKGNAKKIKIPYFIGVFIVAIIVNTYVPAIQPLSPYIVKLAKVALTLTLFLIGSSLTFQSLKTVGIRPLVLAISIWIFISVTSLTVILQTVN
ncbi:YeiH family protein [Aquimarina longa]|uniref:YeiH family protein n=1 Tax=Aquimarina longa TaxID=1080221 RepID=UPI00078376D1|nr:putative sulfate exporter family transporter [Aquimarina longa]